MEETFYQKLSKIPPSVRKAIGSDLFIQHMEQVEKKFSLKEGSSSRVKRAIQNVLINALRPQFFIATLMDEVGVDQKIATAIATWIEDDIFAPVAPDLTNYGIDIAAIKIFQSGAGATTEAIGTPQAAAAASSPVVDLSGKTTPATPKIPSEGWSKMSPRDPLIRATIIKLGDKNNLSAPVPLPPIEKVGSLGKEISASPIPRPGQPLHPTPAPSAPLIIHGMEASGASPKNIDFHFTSPNDSTAHITLDGNKPTPKPASAVVDFGGAHTAAPSVPERPLSKPPLASSPLATSEARKIMEIGAMPDPQLIPKIPIPATPPPPPAPHPATEAVSHSSMPGYISFSRPATPPPPPAAMPPKPAQTILAAPVPPSPQRPPATPPPSPVRPPATTPTVIVKNFTEGGK